MSKPAKLAPENIAKAPQAQPVNGGKTPAAARILHEQAVAKKKDAVAEKSEEKKAGEGK